PGEFADVLGEVLKRLDIAARTAAGHEAAPGLDFPRFAFVFRVRPDPFENLAVALPGGELLLQRGGVEPEKILQALIDGSVVIVFAVGAGDRGAAFIEKARQGDVTAEAAMGTARRALGEIGRGDGG